MTDQERAAIVAEIAAMVSGRSRDELPEPNFTVLDLAAELDCSVDIARRYAKRLVDRGVLGAEKVIDQGQWRWIFWKVGATGNTKGGL